MADTQFKKVLSGGLWASANNAERFDPEDVGIVRVHGFTVAYEQVGSGREPEREVFNQKFREWDGAFSEKTRWGVIQWDGEIDYPGDDTLGYAFTTGSDGNLYVALIPSGPTTGNPTDPTSAGQMAWRRY